MTNNHLVGIVGLHAHLTIPSVSYIIWYMLVIYNDMCHKYPYLQAVPVATAVTAVPRRFKSIGPKAVPAARIG